MGLLSIGEVAAGAGIQPSAVRYYESVGLLAAPQRAGGKRRYTPDAVKRLKLIGLFKQCGFTIADLQVLLRSEPWPDRDPLEALIQQKRQELDRLARQVKLMKGVLATVWECGCLGPEECSLLEL